jgi:hypothetical protein
LFLFLLEISGGKANRDLLVISQDRIGLVESCRLTTACAKGIDLIGGNIDVRGEDEYVSGSLTPPSERSVLNRD